MTTAALIPMKWADDPRLDDVTRCACCDKQIKGEPRHWVECTADMSEVAHPGLDLDPADSGGFFPVGPTCAKRHFRGFTYDGEIVAIKAAE